MVAFCGQVLTRNSRLPRDGATLYVSTKRKTTQSPYHFGPVKEPEFRPEIQEALKFVSGQQRMPTRERLRVVIDDVLQKRFELFPQICMDDMMGNKLCENYGMFLNFVSHSKGSIFLPKLQT